ncbi:MAG: hypothetical protein A2152_01455 [Candidatus Levybacteria bacterium RBG_16_35_6]|nr:MAG: hypothetical protein A2152_01455 [Candidatus Levybacteria bacterium RBG_16_35_6]
MGNKKIIIGITGGFGSGKTSAADFLRDQGFVRISLVQFLEEDLKELGIRNITRKILQDLGNEWREKFGQGILAKKALLLIKKNKIKKAVVDGFRNIGEIEEFRKEGNFTLIGIVVNRDVRFKRIKKLKRREKLTWDLFNKLDSRDLGVNEENNGLQVALCLAFADIFVENNGGIEDLREKMRKTVIDIEKKYE